RPRLTGHRGEECARIAAPAPVLAFVIRNEREGGLIDVVFLADLPEEVPLGASGLEGTQDDVPAARIEETPRVAPIGVGDDRPIAATERSRQKLRDRGTFAGASRADEFEMLGFIR